MMKTNRSPRRRHAGGGAVLAAALLGALIAGATPAAVAAPTGPAPVPQKLAPQDRVELNKLVQQRNRLAKELRGLDEQASTLIKQGRDATVVHAQQVSTQDQLDLVELRLAILATRHGVPIPPLPETSPSGSAAAGDPNESTRFDRAFARGRERAVDRMRDDALRLLASLDFDAFLAR